MPGSTRFEDRRSGVLERQLADLAVAEREPQRVAVIEFDRRDRVLGGAFEHFARRAVDRQRARTKTAATSHEGLPGCGRNIASRSAVWRNAGLRGCDAERRTTVRSQCDYRPGDEA